MVQREFSVCGDLLQIVFETKVNEKIQPDESQNVQALIYLLACGIHCLMACNMGACPSAFLPFLSIPFHLKQIFHDENKPFSSQLLRICVLLGKTSSVASSSPID